MWVGRLPFLFQCHVNLLILFRSAVSAAHSVLCVGAVTAPSPSPARHCCRVGRVKLSIMGRGWRPASHQSRLRAPSFLQRGAAARRRGGGRPRAGRVRSGHPPAPPRAAPQTPGGSRQPRTPLWERESIRELNIRAGIATTCICG